MRRGFSIFLVLATFVAYGQETDCDSAACLVLAKSRYDAGLSLCQMLHQEFGEWTDEDLANCDAVAKTAFADDALVCVGG